jgi:putative transcriptional regulator
METPSLKGQFLIAMPLLTDPNFYRSVTCLCEHNETGAMGVTINRIYSALTAEDIFKELKVEHQPEAAKIPIHIGGPVHMDEIFVLHGPPMTWEGCLEINDRIGLSNTLDLLRAIALGKGPENYLILLGCAGWGPGQLDMEIKENSWLTCPGDEEIIFNNPVETRWDRAVKKLGIDPASLSDAAGHA